MDFTLSADQEALRDGVRQFCARRYAEDALRAQTPVDRALWQELAGLGVFALRLASPDGADLGMAEAVLAFEELGRALVPGPLVASHLAAGLVDGADAGTTAVSLVEGGADPVLLEHTGFVDAVLVLAADTVRDVPAAALVGEPVILPVDPLTPLLRVGDSVPDGDTLDVDPGTLLLHGAVPS